MNRIRLSACRCAAIAIVLLLTAPQAQAAIIYDVPDSLYQQSFDSLPSSGGFQVFTNDSTLRGWSSFNNTGGPLGAITPTNGSLSGGLISYGVNLATERALGILNLGNNTGNMAVAFTNQAPAVFALIK